MESTCEGCKLVLKELKNLSKEFPEMDGVRCVKCGTIFLFHTLIKPKVTS